MNCATSSSWSEQNLQCVTQTDGGNISTWNFRSYLAERFWLSWGVFHTDPYGGITVHCHGKTFFTLAAFPWHLELCKTQIPQLKTAIRNTYIWKNTWISQLYFVKILQILLLFGEKNCIENSATYGVTWPGHFVLIGQGRRWKIYFFQRKINEKKKKRESKRTKTNIILVKTCPASFNENYLNGNISRLQMYSVGIQNIKFILENCAGEIWRQQFEALQRYTEEGQNNKKKKTKEKKDVFILNVQNITYDSVMIQLRFSDDSVMIQLWHFSLAQGENVQLYIHQTARKIYIHIIYMHIYILQSH